MTDPGRALSDLLDSPPHPNPVAAVARRYRTHRRRRMAVVGTCGLAVVLAGGLGVVSIVSPASQKTGVLTSASPSPSSASSSDQGFAACSNHAATPTGATPGNPPVTPSPTLQDPGTARLTNAIDDAAPTEVTRACPAISDLFFRAGRKTGPIIDVTTASWTGSLPPLVEQSRVTHHYANGDESRSTSTDTETKVELWVGHNLISWTVNPPSDIAGARESDLQGWADRVHTALS